MTDGTELLIFDCDGVLVDSERVSLDVSLMVAGEFGWELTAEAFVDGFIGRSGAAISALLEERLEAGQAARFLERFWQVFNAELERRLTPVEGVVAALDLIAARTAWQVCVASNSSAEHVKAVLARTGLYERFAGRIFSAHEVERGKPAPDLFLHAAATMRVAPERCVVIEDSRSGVEAARAAGMRSFGYAGGLTPPAWLAGAGTVVFTDMRLLPELLGGAE